MELQAFLNTYFENTGVFKDNTTGDITPEKLRVFARDLGSLLLSNTSSTANPEAKRFGFVDEQGRFTGLQIDSYEPDVFVSIIVFLKNEIVFVSGVEDGNVFFNLSAFVNEEGYLNENGVANHRSIGMRMTTESSLQQGYTLLFANPFSHLKRYFIDQAFIPNTGDVNFYYDGYNNWWANNEQYKAVGDVFEIYFKAKNDGFVQFFAINYDYFTLAHIIEMNKFYKFTVYALPYSIDVRFCSVLQEILEEATN